jgi:hypothetical protein
VRVPIVLGGVATALAGLAVAGHQATLWLDYGIWTPVPFSSLWFALGGATPDRLGSLSAEAQ